MWQHRLLFGSMEDRLGKLMHICCLYLTPLSPSSCVFGFLLTVFLLFRYCYTSSSLQGFFEESGPFTMAAKGGIIENPYSWTKAGVNFMALESPVGVGFSYCSNQIEKNESCYSDDQSTAKMNKAALIDFYQLFPELKGGDLYISGTFIA